MENNHIYQINRENIESLKIEIDAKMLAYEKDKSNLFVASKILTNTNTLAKIIIAYSAYLLKNQEDNVVYENLDIEDDIIELFDYCMTEFRDFILRLHYRYEKIELLAYILFYEEERSLENGYIKTPNSIIQLAEKILNVNSNDKLLELFGGKSSLSLSSYIHVPEANYTVIEDNETEYAVLKLRLLALEAKIKIRFSDVFDYNFTNTYDKAFANYPFVLKNYLPYHFTRTLAQKCHLEEEVLMKASSDWIFNLLLIQSINESGKAIGIMTNGSFWKKHDQVMWQYFVENGYINAIISLPENIFEESAVATSMIVLSKGNKSVRMIDASKFGEKSKKSVKFSNKDIDNMVNFLEHDNDLSTELSIDELRASDYNLYPLNYIGVLSDLRESIELGDCAKISRGLEMKAKQFDSFKSNQESKYRYLNLSNIIDGDIEIEGNYLSALPSDKEKHYVKNDCIVLSKTASPFFKSAVVNVVEPEETIIASSNVFIIEVDKAILNPYYLQAFFMSELGKNSIKSASTGGKLPIVSISQLKKIKIPLYSKEIQNRIANEYQETILKMKELRHEYHSNVARLDKIYRWD